MWHLKRAAPGISQERRRTERKAIYLQNVCDRDFMWLKEKKNLPSASPSLHSLKPLYIRADVLSPLNTYDIT